MRTTLLGSLLDAARHNVARGVADVALFEQGRVYFVAPLQPLPHEHRSLAALLHGGLAAPSWRGAPPRADFFAAKAVLEALGRVLRVEALQLEPLSDPASEPFLWSGRAARVSAGGAPVGWLGELHPLVARAWDLEDAAAFELDLDRLLEAVPAQRRYLDLISYPALRQDLAVAVGEDVAAAAVVAVVRAAGGELLDSVSVFDVYRGEQLGAGRKSLALSLAFRAPDRTLTDEDVRPLRAAIVEALRERLGGELRA
jgi:phenylalanyl-tRNA synthetase beta chain